MQLANYQTRYRDWRELFRSVDRIEKVTKEDIRRVANETFNDTNRTVGVIETAGAPEQGNDAQGSQDQSRSNGAPARQSPPDQSTPDRASAQRGGAQ